MDSSTIGEIALLLLSFLFSAIFSGSEVALFSLDERRLEILPLSSRVKRYVSELLSDKKHLLITILLGNNLVNVGASIVGVNLTIKLVNFYAFDLELAIAAQVLLLTTLFLLFSEITPKLVATRYPESFANFSVPSLYWFNVLAYPISKSLSEFIKSVFSGVSKRRGVLPITEKDFTHLADISLEMGAIQQKEFEMIQSIPDFRKAFVREKMRPRVDIYGVPFDVDFNETYKIIRESGYSRLPVYKEDLDEIIGVLFAKELLPYLYNEELQQSFSPLKIIKKPFFVPGTKLISDLMKEFQQKKTHIAIVVDEYGGTEGIITMEDIVEEIVGDIRDEYDDGETAIEKLSESTFLFEGSYPFSDLCDYFELEEEDNSSYDSIAGYILEKAQEIPSMGFSTSYKNLNFTVVQVRNRRVLKVKVQKQYA